MEYKSAFKASTTSLNSNGSRCSTDMMPSHARAEETAEVESKGKSKRSGSSRVKKTSFFGSFYKLHSSSREDTDAKKHKSSESPLLLLSPTPTHYPDWISLSPCIH